MKRGYKVEYRRKREGKTDYRARLKLLRSRKTRIVVRKSSKYVRAQLMQYNKRGDKNITSAFSKELRKLGWNYGLNNLPAAYLTGLLCGMRAKDAKIKDGVFDIGLSEPIHGSRLFAALKGAIDGGLTIPHDEKALPAEERINGAHIAAYARALKKDNPKAFKRYFSEYLKAKADPEKMPQAFEDIKKKILGGSK